MMPGPEEFRRDIRAAKRFGLAQGLLLLPSLFSLILAIAFAVDGSWRETAMAVGVCVLLAGVLVCLECKEKRLRRESTQYYTFPLPRAFDYETVCTAIETASGVQWTYLCDETARICRIEGVFSWRVALLYQPEFFATVCKAQRDRQPRPSVKAGGPSVGGRVPRPYQPCGVRRRERRAFPLYRRPHSAHAVAQ